MDYNSDMVWFLILVTLTFETCVFLGLLLGLLDVEQKHLVGELRYGKGDIIGNSLTVNRED